MNRWAENGVSDVPKPQNPPHPSQPEEKDGRDLALKGAEVETVPPRRRRSFSASEKLRLINAADDAVASGRRGALEELLRKEGIYCSHLSTWRQQLAAGGAARLAGQKPGRKPKLDAKDRELAALRKQKAELERQLRIANAVIELQKKAHEVLGIALPVLDEES
jgi:transposase